MHQRNFQFPNVDELILPTKVWLEGAPSIRNRYKIENRRSGHSCRVYLSIRNVELNWRIRKSELRARREFNVFVRLTVGFRIGVACASRPTLTDGQNLIKFRETLITLSGFTSELSLPFQPVQLRRCTRPADRQTNCRFFRHAIEDNATESNAC